MFEDDERHETFGDMVRSIAREIGDSIERLAGQVDVDDLAGYVGVDRDRAREWVETTASWIGSQLEHFGDEVAARGSGAAAQDQPTAADDPFRRAAPHPLDLPTEEQALGLAALDSGRWTIEPDTGRVVARGGGPEPRDSLGLVGELRARDWVTTDGRLTVAGRSALGRWLDASR
jgi:hypothetical protein